MTPIWHGTADEASDLLAAVEHACSCQFDVWGARASACPAHLALATDQRFLNGLLAQRRRAEQLWMEEIDA